MSKKYWGRTPPEDPKNYSSLAGRVGRLNVDFWYLTLLQKNIEEKEEALESLKSSLDSLEEEVQEVGKSKYNDQICFLRSQISFLEKEIEKLSKSFVYFCNDTQPN